jgi:hypothetical protein
VLVLRLSVVAAVMVLAGCTGEEATPLDELPPTTVEGSGAGVTTPHLLEPTDEMRNLARRQCLDDPDLVQGEVNAVDPSNPEEVLASAVVDCSTVR